MKDKDIIHIFQGEFNRLLTPMEIEIIEEWQKEYKEDLIIESLKQAVFNGAISLRYINKILSSNKVIDNNAKDNSEDDLGWLN